MNTGFIVEPKRRTPVIYDVDVAVVGGGSAGVSAAIAASRNGAETVLIERFGCLGGCSTVGRNASFSNTIQDGFNRQIVGGFPVELVERLVKAGATPYKTTEDALRAFSIPVDPEHMALVLFDMVEEAGVKLMLQTYFADAIVSGDSVQGVIVQNKSGRQAVKTKVVVDASGEADVAASAGAPCTLHPERPQCWGLLLRMVNVDFDKVIEYVKTLKPGPWPEFTTWLAKNLGMSEEEVKKRRGKGGNLSDWRWRDADLGFPFSWFVDPVRFGHAPHNHPGSRYLTSATIDWIKERWEREGVFYHLEVPIFRHLVKKAVENGDLAFLRKVDEVGEIFLGNDGFAGGGWGKGVSLVNIVCMTGLNGVNGEHVTKAEIAGRRQAFEIANFLRKYVPGFENASLIDIGAQALPRWARMIEGEHRVTGKEVLQGARFNDVIYLILKRFFDPECPISQVPYRMMVPKKVKGLLVAGKCASGGNVVRATLSCMSMGQAAGTAAALAAKGAVTLRRLNIKELQKTLRDQGVILEPPPPRPSSVKGPGR